MTGSIRWMHTLLPRLIAVALVLPCADVAADDIRVPIADTGLLLGNEEIIFVNVSLTKDAKSPVRFSLAVGDKQPAKADRDLKSIEALIERLKKATQNRKGSVDLAIRAHEDADARVVRELLVKLEPLANKVRQTYVVVAEKDTAPNNERIAPPLVKVLEMPGIHRRTAKEPPRKEAMVHVKLTRKNDKTIVTVEKQEVAFDDLQKHLRTFARDPNRRTMLIEHEVPIPHGDIVRIVDVARLAGMNRVLLRAP